MSNIIPKLVFFDLETGGLNPTRHPVIQMAAIAVDQHLEPIETFEAKIRFDEQKANRNSIRKNHYHRGIWAKVALEPEVAARNFGEAMALFAHAYADQTVADWEELCAAKKRVAGKASS